MVYKGLGPRTRSFRGSRLRASEASGVARLDGGWGVGSLWRF